jgi:hypothetical protein
VASLRLLAGGNAALSRKTSALSLRVHEIGCLAASCCTRSYKATTAQNSGWVLPIKSTHSDHDTVVSKRVVRTSSNPFKARQALECVQAKQNRSRKRRHRRTRNATPSTLPDVLKDRVVEGVRCRENFAISSGQKVCGSNA